MPLELVFMTIDGVKKPFDLLTVDAAGSRVFANLLRLSAVLLF